MTLPAPTPNAIGRRSRLLPALGFVLTGRVAGVAPCHQRRLLLARRVKGRAGIRPGRRLTFLFAQESKPRSPPPRPDYVRLPSLRKARRAGR